MAKFSALPSAVTLDGTEIVPAVQSGSSVRTTAQAIANLFKGTRGSDIASAASIDLGAATGSNLHITGTTTISALGTAAVGVTRKTIFDGVLQLTHNATTMNLLTGANITTAAGDTADWVSEGAGNWRMGGYARKSGTPLVPGGVTTVNGVTGAVTNPDLQGTGISSNEVGFRNVPQNSQSTAYTIVAADSGKHIYHPSSDANARTFTIPSNASVAFPIGTVVTIVNETSQVVSIAINSDTLVLAGAGTTGTRSLAQYGIATAIKVTSTRWLISGTGLT